jgi:nicotinamide-nucleotide amidase
MVVCLFGTRVQEVEAFLDGCAVLNQCFLFEVFPEVHVDCSREVASLLIERFTDKVYSLEDRPFEHVVGSILVSEGLTVATAESCTGGLIGHLLTNVPGSSNYYRLGVVAYSNEAKMAVLGVQEGTLRKHGAVSKEVVLDMADGVRRLGHTDIGVSVSGIAGPSGGTKEKPVGTVWMAVSRPPVAHAEVHLFEGNREAIKKQSAMHALNLVRKVALWKV